MTIESNKQVAQDFFAALSAGEVPDTLLTENMTAWTTTNGHAERARFQGGVRLLRSLFPAGLRYRVGSLTAEEDRVAAEVQAEGVLADGRTFGNTYVFILRLRDGRIASVAEHFHPDPVRTMLAPLLQAAMASRGG